MNSKNGCVGNTLSMRKTFHIAAGCRFLSVRPRGVELALIKVLKPRASMQSLGACLRGFGTRLALFTGGGNAANVLTGLKNSYAVAFAGIFDICIHRTAFLERAPVPVAFRDGHDQPGELQPPAHHGSKLVFLTT